MKGLRYRVDVDSSTCSFLSLKLETGFPLFSSSLEYCRGVLFIFGKSKRISQRFTVPNLLHTYTYILPPPLLCLFLLITGRAGRNCLLLTPTAVVHILHKLV